MVNDLFDIFYFSDNRGIQVLKGFLFRGTLSVYFMEGGVGSVTR